MIGTTPVAQGIGNYQLTQADCDRLKVNPESTVSLYMGQRDKYDGNFELHLDLRQVFKSSFARRISHPHLRQHRT